MAASEQLISYSAISDPNVSRHRVAEPGTGASAPSAGEAAGSVNALFYGPHPGSQAPCVSMETI